MAPYVYVYTIVKQTLGAEIEPKNMADIAVAAAAAALNAAAAAAVSAVAAHAPEDDDVDDEENIERQGTALAAFLGGWSFGNGKEPRLLTLKARIPGGKTRRYNYRATSYKDGHAAGEVHVPPHWLNMVLPYAPRRDLTVLEITAAADDEDALLRAIRTQTSFVDFWNVSTWMEAIHEERTQGRREVEWVIKDTLGIPRLAPDERGEYHFAPAAYKYEYPVLMASLNSFLASITYIASLTNPEAAELFKIAAPVFRATHLRLFEIHLRCQGKVTEADLVRRGMRQGRTSVAVHQEWLTMIRR